MIDLVIVSLTNKWQNISAVVVGPISRGMGVGVADQNVEIVWDEMGCDGRFAKRRWRRGCNRRTPSDPDCFDETRELQSRKDG